MERQRTIARSVEIRGIGLHTGEKVTVTLHPAPPRTGIIFKRVDKEGSDPIRVSLRECEADAMRGSVLVRDGTKIFTVEHLLSAIRGIGIDNIVVEIDGSEPPALDGSALPFARKLYEAGLVEQDAYRSFIVLDDPVWISAENALIAAFPYPGFKVSYVISYDHPFLRVQFLSYELSTESFLREIAPARTYAFKRELDTIWKLGLAKGGSLENAIVIDEKGVMNPEGLRFEDEFVRHKILDLIGDMAFLGDWIRAHIVAVRAGHRLHLKLVSRILEEVNRKSVKNRYSYESTAPSLSISTC